MTLYAITATALLAFSVLCNCVYASVHAEDTQKNAFLVRLLVGQVKLNARLQARYDETQAARLIGTLDLRRTRRERDLARAEARLLTATLLAPPIPFAGADEHTPIHDAVRGVG